MYIPTADEANAGNLTRSLQNRRAELDQTAMALPDAIQKELYPSASGPMNVQPGAMQPLQQMFQDVTNRRESADARKTAADAKTTPPEEVSHVVQSIDDRGRVSITPVFKSGKVGDTIVRAGGPTAEGRGHGGAGGAGGGVQGRFDQKELDAAEAHHNAAQAAEKHNWSLVQEYADAAAAPDTNDSGDKVTDPGSGKEVPMNAAQRKLFQSKSNEARGSAMQMQENARVIRQRYGWGEFAPQASASGSAQQSAAPASTAAPAAPQPKVATMADVSAYAKQYKVPTSQAVQAFKAKGYTIGQVQ
jgi:hypothetical protein